MEDKESGDCTRDRDGEYGDCTGDGDREHGECAEEFGERSRAKREAVRLQHRREREQERRSWPD